MLSNELIIWYRKNKRHLPWRQTNDPYKVWLSEIILQQTRVAQGLPYYNKFIENFPTVKHLAKAPQQKVLKLWQGLGYYSRARNLHQAAKTIVKEYKGKFPENYDELKKLKGVGDYTAAAIASICFNEPRAVVDGNVYRVLARVFGIKTPIDSTEGKKQFAKLAQELIDVHKPGTYNQAIMEFGALFCTPANPQCMECPVQNKCHAGSPQKATKFPVKATKTKVRTRHFEYFFITGNNSTFIRERDGKDIWQGLYELPMLEFKTKASPVKVIDRLSKEVFKDPRNKITILSVSQTHKHQLSHQQIMARFWKISTQKPVKMPQYRQIATDKLKKYPFPVLISRYLKEITNFE